MALTVTSARLTAAFNASLTATTGAAVVVPSINHNLFAVGGFNVGTGSAAADKIGTMLIAVTSGTPLVIDLNTFASDCGETINFVKLKGILFSNLSTTAGQDFTLGGGSTPLLWGGAVAWNDVAKAKGGAIILLDPDGGTTITNAGNDKLQIVVAAGTSVAGQLTLIGTSA